MTAGQLLIACALDAVLGDPRCLPHPVRGLGRIIDWYDKSVRQVAHDPVGERIAGIALAVGLPAVSYFIGWSAITLAGGLHECIGKAAGVYMAFTTLAARDLVDHALAVRKALMVGSLEEARRTVGLIVGRDTAELSEPEVLRATVETIAESTADGVVAPLFYLVLGGPSLAMAYKAINTLDSMIGHYENEYRYFGWASARLDDVANWLPARLTGTLLALAAALGSGGWRATRHAWLIFCRDGYKHPSPNSGWPEAAMAGALGIQLGGMNMYGGVASMRPRIGDDGAPLGLSHLDQALALMITASSLATFLALGLLLL